ncbi:Hcp family type VI secretion system effector [Rhodopila sp.]|jgi:type VI secretion system secreted protein Hcp|uniref:Hcp family type VI secretion system effector n=1 Tax=Rhodopila sp. TaxID=2480087 RepID=UPI002CE3CFA7|nr:type VI secretion system tube protein Hcp [Rhodopila sp.]HVZ09613.1 type VI secretion system tube protein Hcp [Rhodopila sp.]
MPIYMNYDSLAIKGDVTAEGYKDWIELNSFQLGVGRGISSPTGASADRESSAPSVSELTVTKAQDAATGKLLTEALQGEGKKVIIDLVKTESGKLAKYLSYELEDTMISGYSISSGGDRPSESLSLNFVKMKCIPQKADKDGKMTAADTVTYDLAQAKVV